MGKLVLTRKAGESVIVTEPNGTTWRLLTEATKGLFGAFSVRLKLSSSGAQSVVDALRPGQSMTFGGGNVELRPSRRGQEVVLAFEFPREVKIMREELV